MLGNDRDALYLKGALTLLLSTKHQHCMPFLFLLVWVHSCR